MNLKENMAIKKLVEHPSNQKLFKDIKESNPVFWIEFVDSIKTFGIIEPLIVNRESMQVRSGNQRLKAALELGLETVPVLLVDNEDTDAEISKMIASNVFRRTIDPFAMFEYIGRLRKGATGKSGTKPSSLSGIRTPNVLETAKQIHKQPIFVSAADIFKTLPEDQKEALEEWFNERAEGEKARSEGELITMIKKLENDNTALEQENKGINDDLKNDEEKITMLDEMIIEKDVKIEELTNTDFDEEMEERDKQINKLLQGQKKLKDKINELKETPDINIYLVDSYKKLLDINVTLKSIMDNQEALNPVKLNQFKEALELTFKIITGNKKQTNKRMELND